MCYITITQSEDRSCPHVYITVNKCKRFQKKYKGCAWSREFCKMSDLDERLQDDWYTSEFRQCEHAEQKYSEHIRRTACNCRGGPCGGQNNHNRTGAIAKYRTDKAKEPYNLPVLKSSGSLRTAMFLAGRTNFRNF